MLNNKKTVIAELIGGKRKYRKKFLLTDDELIMEWDAPNNKGHKGWHFDYLSSNIGHSVERPRGFKEGIIGGIVLMAITIILYFSKVNQYIPLLTPALAIVSVGIFLNGIRKYKITRWTVFNKKDGEIAAYIEHSMCEASELKSFEKAFSNAMNRYKNKK